MKNNLGYLSWVVLVGLVFGGFVYGQKAAADRELPNFDKVNANLYRGGQPTEEGIKQLAEKGVRTIINLRGEGGLADEEEQWAEKAGIRFINAGLRNWFRPKDRQIDEILALIDDEENQPVFVHCRRGSDRTGTVIAVYRMTHDGWTAKRAKKEARKLGFGWWQFWMSDYISDYYRELQN